MATYQFTRQSLAKKPTRHIPLGLSDEFAAQTIEDKEVPAGDIVKRCIAETEMTVGALTIQSGERFYLVAEPRNVSVGRFSITETEAGVFTLIGLDLSAGDREDLEMLLSAWKYGLVDGGGEPTSTWSEEKLQSARAWLDAHRAE